MSVIIFFIVLLVLVVAHEFGHFIVAKKSGIRVDEFAFGFPPRLWSIKKGETRYSFNALPLGGFVKIYGEDPLEVKDDQDRKRSFVAQPRYIQAAVIVAGVVFNILLAWLLISATLMIGILAPQEDGRVLEHPVLMVTGIHEKSPAELAGLQSGDTLLSISDGGESVTITSADDVMHFIAPREGHKLTVNYLRKEKIATAEITPVSGIVPGGAAIGIFMDTIGTLRLSPPAALWEGAKRTFHYTEMTASGIWGFLATAFTGKSDFSQVTGPVGIVKAVGEAAGIGFTNVMLFTALISINLAVINVIPFPALDGGRLLFIVIEAIMRRPIKAKVANMVNLAGFSLLMILMLLVTYHDIVKLF